VAPTCTSRSARRASTNVGCSRTAALVEEIVRAKPAASKGRYIKGITLTTTMGPGLHVDPTRVRGIMEAADAEAAGGEAATV
jgi:hypothetical protein